MNCAVVDSRISNACRSRLIAEGFCLITLPPHSALGAPVASHTDMLIARIGENLVFNRSYANAHPEIIDKIRVAASKYNIVLDDAVLSEVYPNDCVYNSLVTNEKIYTAHTDNDSISHLANKMGKTLVKIKQGYPACTTLLLNGKRAVTADEGMARVLRSDGFSVTIIENGDISLPPHAYGFIGGACGVFRNTVYFCGDVGTHRSFDKISTAIKDAGMNYICLSDEKLSDLGGIIFL